MPALMMRREAAEEAAAALEARRAGDTHDTRVRMPPSSRTPRLMM